MADRKMVMSWLEGLTQDDWQSFHSDSEVQQIAIAALELLKEHGKQKFFVDENGKITPLPVIVRCKDCKWYDERISMCDNCGLPREQTFFCADGKRR